MAYLFQHGPAILSGAVDQEGSIDIKDDGSGEFELKHDGNTIISSTRALANVTTISGSEAISGRDLKLDVGGKVGISTDADLMTLTAGNVAVAGAMSASARLDAAGLRIDTGGVIGTAGDNDLLTLNNDSLVVAGAGTFSGGNLAASAGAVSGSTGLAGRGVTVDSSGYVGTATDADLLQLADNELRIAGDLSASADVQGLKANFESYEVKDGLVIDGSRNITAVQLSGSGNLLAAGTVRFDGVADAAAVDADSIYFLDADDGLMKKESVTDLRDLYFGDVSGDATIAAGGALTIAANAVEGSMINSNAAGDGLAYSSNALQLDLNELTAAAVDVSADSIAIVDATDASSKKESIADLVSAMAGAGLAATDGVLSVQSGDVRVIDDGNTLAEGYNFYTGSAAKSVQLPASPSIGDVVVVKAGNLGDGNGLTVVRDPVGASHTIDGLTQVVLESDYAAASFVYLEANNWGII